MKNQRKLKAFFLIFAIILASDVSLANNILPLPKPVPDQEIKINYD